MNKKDKIDFWSKHQELDKFNIGNDTAIYLGYLAIVISAIIFLPDAIKVALSEDSSDILKMSYATLLLVLALFILILTKNWLSKVNGHNDHFRVRESMIRVWHDSSKANKKNIKTTIDLDGVFTEIIEKLKENPEMDNRDLYKKAKEIMEK